MAQIVEYLVDADVDNKTLFCCNFLGLFPLHIACGLDARKEGVLRMVELLLEADVEKKTLSMKCQRGYIPLQIAFLRLQHGEPSDVLELLLAADSKYHTRLTMEAITSAVAQINKRAKTSEERFDKRLLQRISDHNANWKKVRAVELELALWKAAVLRKGCFKSWKEVDQHLGKETAAIFKSDCLVSCGAGMVIQKVFEFLE